MLNIYRTRQLPQAAFLLASGATFLRTEKNSQSRYVNLVFSDPDGKVERLADTYYDGAPCSAMGFYRALTEMRHAISDALGTVWQKDGAR